MTLGQLIYAEIESKTPLPTFTYQVIARGKVLRAETIKAPNSESHIIEFPATFEMAPSARLLVYYFKENEIQSTCADINLRDELNNLIELKVSSLKAKPGSTVDIAVSTSPHSFVGLLGVDQSVLLLKANEGLSKEDAFNEIEQYQYAVHESTNAAKRIHAPYYANSYWNDFRVSSH